MRWSSRSISLGSHRVGISPLSRLSSSSSTGAPTGPACVWDDRRSLGPRHAPSVSRAQLRPARDQSEVTSRIVSRRGAAYELNHANFVLSPHHEKEYRK